MRTLFRGVYLLMSTQRQTKIMTICLAVFLLVALFSVTNTLADCTVRFTGRVDMPESPSGSACIGNYKVPVVVYDVLEDPCNALSFYGFPLEVAYDEAQNLDSFDMVEVYGYACTNNCTFMQCGMIDATKTSSEDYYIGIIPEANFSADPIIGIGPLVVSFADSSTGAIESWSWDFDNDGTEDSSEQNPSITYYAHSCEDLYTVSLTVSGPAGGSDTETKTDYIIIYPTPNAGFGAAPISGPPPLCVHFTPYNSCSSVIDNWSWDFDNDGIADSTYRYPQHCYESVGFYTVSLTVSGPYGSDTETRTDFINVHTDPIIYDLRRGHSEPGDILKIDGVSFGDGTNSMIHFGKKELPSDHKRIKVWTDTQIRVKIPKKKYVKNECSWFKGEDTRKLKLWVTVGGIDSNVKRLTLTKPLDCQ